MKKQKIFDIYCDVYGTNLTVLLNMKPEKVCPYLEKKYKIKWKYGDSSNLKAGGIFEFDVWPYRVLWIKNNTPKEDFIPKLAHEIFHHVLRLCVDKQIPTYPNIDNLIMDEAAAYLIEFYMREILKKSKAPC